MCDLLNPPLGGFFVCGVRVTAYAKATQSRTRPALHFDQVVRRLVATLARLLEGTRKGLKPVPKKALLSLRIDADVIEWFRAQGAGYQSRMNALLRAYMEAHR